MFKTLITCSWFLSLSQRLIFFYLLIWVTGSYFFLFFIYIDIIKKHSINVNHSQQCQYWSKSLIFPWSQDRALDYLSTCIDQVHTFGDILQLVIVELIYKVSSSWFYVMMSSEFVTPVYAFRCFDSTANGYRGLLFIITLQGMSSIPIKCFFLMWSRGVCPPWKYHNIHC